MGRSLRPQRDNDQTRLPRGYGQAPQNLKEVVKDTQSHSVAQAGHHTRGTLLFLSVGMVIWKQPYQPSFGDLRVGYWMAGWVP